VGSPGLVLAVAVATLREPIRGLSEGLPAQPVAHPFREFFAELMTIIFPLSLVAAAGQGSAVLWRNLLGLAIIALLASGLIVLTGDKAQWVAVGIGTYAIYSWALALKKRDAPAFRLIWGTPAFLAVLVGYGLIAFVNYAVMFWSLPYAESVLGADKSTAGLIIGGGGAAGGFIGLNIGGRIADRLRRSNPSVYQ